MKYHYTSDLLWCFNGCVSIVMQKKLAIGLNYVTWKHVDEIYQKNYKLS